MPTQDRFAVASDVSNDGGMGTAEWQDLGQLVSNNDSSAFVVLAAGQTSQFLVCTNFGFTLGPDSVAKYIWPAVRLSASTDNAIRWAALRMIRDGQIELTDDPYMATYSAWQVDLFYQTVYVETGVTGTWTTEQLNSTGFGFALAIVNSSAVAVSGFLDLVSIGINYTVGGGMGASQSGLMGVI